MTIIINPTFINKRISLFKRLFDKNFYKLNLIEISLNGINFKVLNYNIYNNKNHRIYKKLYLDVSDIIEDKFISSYAFISCHNEIKSLLNEKHIKEVEFTRLSFDKILLAAKKSLRKRRLTPERTIMSIIDENAIFADEDFISQIMQLANTIFIKSLDTCKYSEILYNKERSNGVMFILNTNLDISKQTDIVLTTKPINHYNNKDCIIIDCKDKIETNFEFPELSKTAENLGINPKTLFEALYYENREILKKYLT